MKKLSSIVSAPRTAFEESVKVKLSNRINAIIEQKLYTKRDRTSRFLQLNLFFWFASIPRMMKPLFNSTKSCITIKLSFENEWSDSNSNRFYFILFHFFILMIQSSLRLFQYFTMCSYAYAGNYTSFFLIAYKLILLHIGLHIELLWSVDIFLL